MKKILTLLLLIAATQVSAAEEGPLDMFGTSANYTKTSRITWVPVNDVNKACEAESQRRGFGGFGIKMEACAFWDVDPKTKEPICYILTPRTVNYWQIGHEMRHCFQGPWHG
jgi:hypothetical protein